MNTLLHGLIVQGILILSPSHPYKISNTSQALWLSNQEVIQVRNAGNSSILEVQKKGAVHVLGLNSSNESQKIVAVDDEDYNSLKQCPTAPISIENEKIYWTDSNLKNPLLEKCHFKNLHMKNPNVFALEFDKAEQKLKNKGYRIHSSKWEDEQRNIVLAYSDLNKIKEDEIKSGLGDLAPFYKVTARKTPTPGNTLIFELTLFEFSRDKAEKLGLQWPTQIKVKSLEGLNFNSSKSVAVGEFIADFGESQGVGKILARPQLRATPGENAKFQSGGELPIRQSSLYSQKTQWKNYGLILELKSDENTKAGDQEISVDFKLELSEPDEATAVDGVPGILKRSLESRFELPVGETTILSSLYKTRSGKNRKGFIGLSRIPLLNFLFSGTSNTNNQSELWFAIKPIWDSIKVSDQESKEYDVKL